MQLYPCNSIIIIRIYLFCNLSSPAHWHARIGSWALPLWGGWRRLPSCPARGKSFKPRPQGPTRLKPAQTPDRGATPQAGPSPPPPEAHRGNTREVATPEHLMRNPQGSASPGPAALKGISKISAHPRATRRKQGCVDPPRATQHPLCI